jgi:oligopeptide/dipeptide ABC transporter ATP-binding protein
VPHPDPDIPMSAPVSGEVASPINPPSGCRFHPRCPIYRNAEDCHARQPEWREVRHNHFVACHKVEPAPVP